MKFRKSKNVIVYEEFDEVILINMMKNKFYSLDKMGTVIWKYIENIGDIALIINEISDKYNADPNVVKKDIEELVEELVKGEVIYCDGKI